MKNTFFIGLLIYTITGFLSRQGFDAHYQLKSELCILVSETKLWERETIQNSNLAEFLRPGDIILTKRNGYLSNLFITGNYTHAALYMGTTQQISEKGLVATNGDNENSEQAWVIESLKNGVQLSPLNKVLDADHCLFIRPMLPDPCVTKAIFRAIDMLGRPYDFNFDFGSGNRIACTELIWKSYGHAEIFEEHSLLGKPFTTPEQIAMEAARIQPPSMKKMAILNPSIYNKESVQQTSTPCHGNILIDKSFLVAEDNKPALYSSLKKISWNQ